MRSSRSARSTPRSQRSLDRWNSVAPDRGPGDGRGRPVPLRPSGRLLPRGDLGPPARAERPARRGPPVPGPGPRSRRPLHASRPSFERLIRYPTIAVSTLAADSLETTCHLRVESVERFSGDLARVKAELEGVAAGDRVLIACHNAAEAERLGEVFSDTELARSGPAGPDRRPRPLGLPPHRRPDAGHRRSRAVRPRRGPPPRHPPPVREPGHRQLPRPQRGRPGRPRQPRDRPLPRPPAPRTSRTTTTRRPCSSSSPRGPSSTSRSPRSTWCRSTSAAARPSPRSRRSAHRPGRSGRSGSPRPSSTWPRS